MKTLKKTLCLVLAVVMVVGVLVLPAYAKDDYKTAITKLQKYGVLQGYPDGDLHEDAMITRGQMAAIIYRVMTGDTGATDAEVAVKYGSYADKFTDADVAPWAKGYIGFCANKGVLKGYDTGAVQPNKQISGYEVMAMLLRALGYDHNGEYTGADWKYNVLSDAAKTGVNKNVTEISPDAATPRKAVAQYTYDASKANLVAPKTNPVGYESLNETLISEGTATTGTDDFGVPTTTTPIKFNWPDTPEDGSYTDSAKLLNRWYAPVVECDVATAAGIDADTLFTTYTNGKANKGYDTINPTDERSTIGYYGRETSLYEGKIIVYKDVVLAKVTAVTPKITDNAGHTVKKASYTVEVYYGDGADGHTIKATTESDTDFAKGDMIRAYCLTDTGNIGTAKTVTLKDAVKVTETQVTVDAIIENTYKNPSGFKGTDGNTYMYSWIYSYNGGTDGDNLIKLKDTNIGSTWGVYTDGHGNVLSLKAAETVKGYGVITDIDAEKVAFGQYAAKLTILTADNKTVTIQVLNYDYGSRKYVYYKSEDEIANELGDQLGQLVQYGENTNANITGYNEIKKYGDIRVQNNNKEILAGEVRALDGCPLVNDNTVFFIEQYTVSASKGGYTANGYKVVKGFKNIGDLSHNVRDTVDGKTVRLTVSFIDTNPSASGDNWAEYVLITGATIVKEDKKEDVKDYAFLVNPTGMVETHDTIRLYKAVIDGVETTLSLTFNASNDVHNPGLYTYADRNTNNGAYGDVEYIGNIVNNTNLAKAYVAGALDVNGRGYYLAVADDVKVFFVNPETGKSTESKYNLETVLTTPDFNISYVCYQTNEYGFIDLVYVVSGVDDTSLTPETNYATIGVTSYEDGDNKGWIAVGVTETATDAQKLAAVYDYLTAKFPGYTVTVTQANGGRPTAKATLTSNGVTTSYEWKVNLDGKVITFGEEEEAIGAIGSAKPVYIGDILVDAGKVAKADISKVSAVVTDYADGSTYIHKAGALSVGGGRKFLAGHSYNIVIGAANTPAVLPAPASEDADAVKLSGVTTPIDANGNKVELRGDVTAPVTGATEVTGTNVNVGKDGSIEAETIANGATITVNEGGSIDVNTIAANATVTVEKDGSLTADYIEAGATVEAKDLTKVSVSYQEEPVKYTGDEIKTFDEVPSRLLFDLAGNEINIPAGDGAITSVENRDEYCVRLGLDAGWYHVELFADDEASDTYYEDFEMSRGGNVIYMFCPKALNDGDTPEESNSQFYKVVPDDDDTFMEKGTGLDEGTWNLVIWDEYGDAVYSASFTVKA